MNTRQLEFGDVATAQSVVKQFHGRDVSTEHMARLLRKSSNFFLVAEAEGEIIGFLLAHELDNVEQEATAMFIYEIEVAESHRRRGVGAALIKHIQKIADQKQMFEMFVFTDHANQGAVAFYQATGGQIEDGDELMFVYPRPSNPS